MNVCNSCHTDSPADAKRCRACGTPLGKKSEKTAAAAPAKKKTAKRRKTKAITAPPAANL